MGIALWNMLVVPGVELFAGITVISLLVITPVNLSVRSLAALAIVSANQEILPALAKASCPWPDQWD